MSEPDRTALFKASPSPTPPFAISELLFSSEIYCQAARNDIEHLLSLFSRQWSEHLRKSEATPAETTENGHDAETAARHGDATAGPPTAPLRKSPPKKASVRKPRTTSKLGPTAFGVFKQCWVHSGWDKVHISIVNACLRSDWFRTISRLLLERLGPAQPNDLKKAGALLGLYTFWASQPTSIDQEHIILDIALLDCIDSAPELLAGLLDGSDAEKRDEDGLRASDDLFMVVHLMHHAPLGSAFFLAPKVAVDYPGLPSNSLGVAKDVVRSTQLPTAHPAKRARLAAPTIPPSYAVPDVDQRVDDSESPPPHHHFAPDLDWISRNSSRVLHPASQTSAMGGGVASTPTASPLGVGQGDGTVRGHTWADVTTGTGEANHLTAEELNELLLQGPGPRASSGADSDAAVETNDVNPLLDVGVLTHAARAAASHNSDSAGDAYLNFLREPEM